VVLQFLEEEVANMTMTWLRGGKGNGPGGEKVVVDAEAKDKADRMQAYLEEKYERLKRDKEEEQDRRASLEETMVIKRDEERRRVGLW